MANKSYKNIHIKVGEAKECKIYLKYLLKKIEDDIIEKNGIENINKKIKRRYEVLDKYASMTSKDLKLALDETAIEKLQRDSSLIAGIYFDLSEWKKIDQNIKSSRSRRIKRKDGVVVKSASIGVSVSVKEKFLKIKKKNSRLKTANEVMTMLIDHYLKK